MTKQASQQGKLDTKVKQHAKIKAALKIVLPSVRESWKKLGLKYSRQQLLESLVPAADKKGVGKELVEAGKSLKESKASSIKSMF